MDVRKEPSVPSVRLYIFINVGAKIIQKNI